MGLELKLIKTINKKILKNFTPSYTFLNIVNENNLISRLKKEKN